MENKEELKETVSKEENAADFLPKKEKPNSALAVRLPLSFLTYLFSSAG